MILVTGGMGFIGSHTVRALTEAGEECVLLQRRTPQVPPHLADLPIHVVQADVADLDALLDVGRKYPITGIVHLAVALPWPVTDGDPIEATGAALEAFLNIVRAAQAWGVRRVVTASTIGVYGFAYHGALTEDMPISFEHIHPIPTFKKITELLAGHLSDVTDVNVVNARISGTWGPGGHLPDPFFAAPSLAHAAALRAEPDLSGLLAPRRQRTRSTCSTSRTPVARSHCCSSRRSCTTPRTTSAPVGPRATPTSSPRSAPSSPVSDATSPRTASAR